MQEVEKTIFAEETIVNKVKNMISVIIPVFNEEKGVESVIKKLQEILFSSNLSYEIIIVDDGSTDKSVQILEHIEGIKLIKHHKNIGYGGALKTGIKKSKGDYIIITDGDGTYPNEMIPELIKYLNEYDMVVGARAMDSKNIASLRKPMKWILGKLANYLAETEIPDLNSGLRAFKKEIALQFFHMYPSGFSFTTTITLAMHCNDYDVKYIPIEYGKREGKSKIKPIKDTLNFIQLIWRTVMYFNPLKIFLPVSVFLFLCFVASFCYDVFILGNLAQKTIIFFLAFVQVTLIGLLADLIEKRSPFKHIN
jgi:glycosyltransferase involved in cell wall biosynthesis